jgi:hypothetical protein
VSDERNTELADALGEFGRRVGQAITDVVDSVRPALDALTEAVAEVAARPEFRGLVDRAEQAMRRRACLCWCQRAHPADRGVCEALDAVIVGQFSSGLLGDATVVPLCAPCAASRAARDFAG